MIERCFSIEEDYQTVVGNRKEEFETSLRQQLAVMLRTDISNIRSLRTWPGSVEVSCNSIVCRNSLTDCLTGQFQSGGPDRAGGGAAAASHRRVQ